MKQGLPFGDSTILEQAVDNLVHSEVDELIVVLGYRAQELMVKVANRPVKIAINPAYEQGMSTSIIAGLHMVDKKARAVMLALGDQPVIGSKIIDKLIAEFYKHNKGIVVPTYRGKHGHPVIFAAKYRPELSTLKGDTGAKKIVEAHPEDALEIEVSSESILLDINTENDYRRQLKNTSA